MPFPPPERALATIAHVRFGEKPHKTLMIMVEVSPSKITGFRPKTSDALPHNMAVRHWLMLNTALVMVVVVR